MREFITGMKTKMNVTLFDLDCPDYFYFYHVQRTSYVRNISIIKYLWAGEKMGEGVEWGAKWDLLASAPGKVGAQFNQFL